MLKKGDRKMANVLTLTTPLMRQTSGFDRFNDLFESFMRETSEAGDNYPPYNIEKIGENDYRIVMAVAGFSMEDLNIVLEGGVLSISGRNQDKENSPEKLEEIQVLHRGIASRAFERTFRLADHIQVTQADLQDGLLTIHLVREIPEKEKPRMITINDGTGKAIENQTQH